MSGYPNLLRYFMWKWQVHFMISCKAAAESLFKKIDPQLLPTCFLIGFSIGEDLTRPPICFEPEKMDFLLKDFVHFESAFNEVSLTNPERNMHYSGGSQKEMEERRATRNFREALKVILDSSKSFPDKIHFIASEVIRDGYRIYIILQLKRSIYLNYVLLKHYDSEELLHRHQSFIDAVTEVYLEDRLFRLYSPDAGRDLGPDRNNEELLRLAASKFFFTIQLVGRSGNFHAIYPACNNLSLLKYEGKENTGHLIISRQNHPGIEMTLELNSPVRIEEYRKIRKLLELTNDTTGIVSDGEFVFGFGIERSTYDSSKEDIFHIFFEGVHCYSLMHREDVLLSMRYGNPEQINYIIEPKGFSEAAKMIFDQLITDEQIENLYKLALAAAMKDSGCLLVFIADASNEAIRLDRQCIAIKPKHLDEETLIVLSTIDGALLIDLDGNVHAKGVILDGVVGAEGDSSRGSRYNSALTYQEYRSWEKPTMIVVVSEDGMVDVIPALKPKIRHSEIKQFINTLSSINTTEAFNAQTFYSTMELLQTRAFYLTIEECNQINELRKSLEKLDRLTNKTVWRTFREFTPNPKMNSKFYIPES